MQTLAEKVNMDFAFKHFTLEQCTLLWFYLAFLNSKRVHQKSFYI